jgi:serine/threonine protein kinase
MSGAPPARDSSPLALGRRHVYSTLIWGEPGRPALRKAVPPGAASSAGLRNEARILALLRDVPGVPVLLEADTVGDWLVQTQLDGQPLGEVAECLRGKVPAVLAWLLSLLDILEAVHMRGVQHGHLAPAKLLWQSSGCAGLLDFTRAVAQRHVESAQRAPPARPASRWFQAPEQTGRMARAVDYRADYYALGAAGYWLLTGHPPLEESDPLAWLHALLTRPPVPASRLHDAVTAPLSAVLDRLLAKNPEQRYQSAHGLRRDLQRCQRGEHFEPGADDHRSQPTRPSRLVGREAAQALLHDALDMADGEHRTVLLRGYAGAGKSALVRALAPA